jgi:3-dehydroquinate dehydratase-2
MKKILILQGPNLNLLGKREPTVYGSESLDDIHTHLQATAQSLALSLQFFQSNHEGELISRVQTLLDPAHRVDWIVINPAAYTHTSVGLRDALLAVNIPFIEVHLSNVHARESFRHVSYFSDVAKGVILGMGSFGYTAALQYIAQAR